MKKKHFSILLVTVFAVVCIVFAGPVRTEEKAIRIAKTVVSIIYRNDFPGYEIRAEPEGFVWVVWYGIPPVFNENGEVIEGVLGGGGPELRILKLNGWIVLIGLQK